jgi:hypothetical protein
MHNKDVHASKDLHVLRLGTEKKLLNALCNGLLLSTIILVAFYVRRSRITRAILAHRFGFKHSDFLII